LWAGAIFVKVQWHNIGQVCAPAGSSIACWAAAKYCAAGGTLFVLHGSGC